MTTYRRVYDSRHLQADCQKPGSAPKRHAGNRVWATFFTFAFLLDADDILSWPSWVMKAGGAIRYVFPVLCNDVCKDAR